MNYENPELLERVAAEYVVGTLRGAARRRFARLYATSAAVRQPVHRWEDDLSLLSRGLAPVRPSARVWTEVQRRTATDRVPPEQRPSRARLWQLAAAAGLVAIAFIVGLVIREQQTRLQTVAVLATDPAHSLWRVERRKELRALTIRTIGPVQLAPEKAYELWALPVGGSPVSLGLLPVAGTLERTLTETQRTAFLAADKLAVSVEPTGGSPTGSPTGPVVIVVKVQGTG